MYNDLIMKDDLKEKLWQSRTLFLAYIFIKIQIRKQRKERDFFAVFFLVPEIKLK